MAVNLMSVDDTFLVKDSELGVPDGDETVIYTIRPITRAVMKALLAKNTKRNPNPHTGGMVDDVNGEAFMDDQVDHCLVGWEGILLKGVPAECSRENKLKLDPSRTAALVTKAALSQKAAEAGRAATFPGSEDVRGVVG